MEREYKYDAFISYRHVEPDQSIAKELHRMIESFKPPKELYKTGKKTGFRVFRDREELAAKDLSTSIEAALQESHYLIVLCSKRTPLSEWCEKEVRTFRALHGDERIIPVLIEGEPEESFSAPLKDLKRGADESLQDVLAADIRPEEVLKKDFPGYETLQNENKGKLRELTKQALKLLKTEKYRILAAMLSCSFGDLKQRDKERRGRLILTISSLSGAIFLLFGIFMANAYQKAEQARQEAVQSNARILMKTSKDIAKEGDYLKSVLVAQEAMKSLEKKMKSYESLAGEESSILNDAIYHGGASTLTSISTGNKLTYIALSNNDKYIAYGLDNNMAAIADVENGEVVREFSGHSQQVKLLVFSNDDKLLVSASFDGSVIIHDVETGEEKARLEIPGVPMLTRFSEDGTQFFYVSFTSNTADFYVFDTTNWKEISKFTVAESVRFADIKKDGSEVLIALSENNDHQLTRRSMKDGSILEVIEREVKVDAMQAEYSVPYKTASYSADGESMLLFTDWDVRKISLSDKSLLFKKDINFSSTAVRPFIESPNGEKLVVQSYSKLFILDGKSGEIQDEVYFENLDMKYFNYNYETNTIIAFGENGKYSIWKDKVVVEDGLNYGGVAPSELKYLKDGSKLIANSHESRTIKIIDTKSRISAEPVYARVIANSNDSSKMILFDGRDFLISADNGKTSEKIILDNTIPFGLMKNTKSYIVSNDGRYFASIWQKGSSGVPFLALYDLEKKENREVELESISPAIHFSDDGKEILLLDEKEGLKVYNTEDLSELQSFPEINESAESMFLSEDNKILALNRFSGIISLFNLETGEPVEEIPGEALYLERNGEEIRIKGIQNNAAFNWSSKSGLTSIEMDEACAQTPVGFDDVNLYNENAGLLLMIRNNDTERKAYVVDFASGRLKMSFTPSIKKYNVNGHISPDGKTIVIDQSYYAKQYNPDAQEADYMSSAVYKILSKEQVEEEINKILAGRTLTKKEKEQIGITAE